MTIYQLLGRCYGIKKDLYNSKRKMADHWEAGRVRGPIHLSGGNEDEFN